MKLGFEESQSPYTSGTQKARAWTEAWVSAQAYCPHCGNAKMSQFPNNSPLADFLCGSCSEEFELKSQKGKFGAKVADGAYKTKCERLAASNNPNLLLMSYDVKSLSVVNLLIVPKHFFVREIIEERKPLAATARRAGWIGSNIILSRVPESGKIHIVKTVDLSISSPAASIACDPRRIPWRGFSISTNVIDAGADGPMNGPACATTNARIAARAT